MVKVPGKQRDVCVALRDAVLRVDAEKFQLCVLHSHMALSPPDLDAALEFIRTARDAHESTVDGQNSAERLLKYAGVVAKDVSLLYDAALGTYDFDLVLMVAQVAQKDPKECVMIMTSFSEYVLCVLRCAAKR